MKPSLYIKIDCQAEHPAMGGQSQDKGWDLLLSSRITQHAEGLPAEQSKTCQSLSSVWMRGRGPAIQQRRNKRNSSTGNCHLFLYFVFLALGFPLWEERNLRTLPSLFYK